RRQAVAIELWLAKCSFSPAPVHTERPAGRIERAWHVRTVLPALGREARIPQRHVGDLQSPHRATRLATRRGIGIFEHTSKQLGGDAARAHELYPSHRAEAHFGIEI